MKARSADLAQATGLAKDAVESALAGEKFVFDCVTGQVALSNDVARSAIDPDAFSVLEGKNYVYAVDVGAEADVNRAVQMTVRGVVGWDRQTLDGLFSSVSRPIFAS